MARAAFRIGPIPRAAAGRVGVIDIGSNSIRLVVYDRLARAPMPVFNEKVMCGLGRSLAATGLLDPDGRRMALENLTRFTRLLEAMNVDRVDVLATAAVRDAADGRSFVEEINRACGMEVAVVSGAEEARLSALGVLSGIPEADGVMGDLGGGSLELVGLDAGRIAEQETLPLGPFRLMSDKASPTKARGRVDEAFAGQGWLEGYRGRRFYAVGGAWRALAKVHMAKREHPIHVIQHYAVPAADMAALADIVAGQGRASLERLAGVSKRRLDALPWAAMVLSRLIATLEPEEIVFSAHGLREGHLFDLLPAEEQARDPLIAACRDAAIRLDRYGFGDVGWMSDWIAPAFGDAPAGFERLRLAAALLSDIGWAEHPDYRAEHAFLHVLRLQASGMSHEQRAIVALAIWARYGGRPGQGPTKEAASLLSEEEKAFAARLGAALRLAHTLTGGASGLLSRTRLLVDGDTVELVLPPDAETLGGDVVARRLQSLAKAMGLAGRVIVAPRKVPAAEPVSDTAAGG
ncbi:MAG: Ppx/GppA family phosphatase [Azospirillaceae bacterium]